MKKSSTKVSRDPNLQSLELSLTEKIGLNVLIKNNKKNRGSITIEYKDIDQLNRIVNIFKSHY